MDIWEPFSSSSFSLSHHKCSVCFMHLSKNKCIRCNACAYIYEYTLPSISEQCKCILPDALWHVLSWDYGHPFLIYIDPPRMRNGSNLFQIRSLSHLVMINFPLTSLQIFYFLFYAIHQSARTKPFLRQLGPTRSMVLMTDTSIPSYVFMHLYKKKENTDE